MEIEQLAREAIKGDDDSFLQLIHLFKIDLYKTALSSGGCRKIGNM
ncbi:MAG: hypothetical protein IE909_17840 [Campylobacterales bacterium]|nr:hypothetical protein [Campylobacterales bacterium]